MEGAINFSDSGYQISEKIPWEFPAARAWATSTQTGANVLQCPHHGAKNLTRTKSNEATVSLKLSAVRMTTPSLSSNEAGSPEAAF